MYPLTWTLKILSCRTQGPASLASAVGTHELSVNTDPRLKKGRRKKKIQVCTCSLIRFIIRDILHCFFLRLHLRNIQFPSPLILSSIHRTRETWTLRPAPIIRRWARQPRDTRARTTPARTPITLSRSRSRHRRRVRIAKVISSLRLTPWSRVRHISVLRLPLRKVGIRGGSGGC